MIEKHRNNSICKHFTIPLKYYIISILTFLFFLASPQKSFAQEEVYLEFIESFNEEQSSDNMSLPVINKANRLKSASSISFNIEHDANVPDSVIKCLEVSADIWRSCLNINSDYTINLQLTWEDLPDDEDVKIRVTHVLDEESQDYVPTSLFYSLRSDLENEGTCDAKITINKNLEWDCGYSIENSIGVRNLNSVMLRSIAIALGFGSSLSLSNLSTGAIVKFPYSKGHSSFDNLLVSDEGVYLKNLSNTGRTQNPDILNFCTGKYGDVHIVDVCNIPDSISLYKMYTPESYEKNKSLIYLDNKQSLMHYSLNKNIKKMQIDPITVNVLNAIGWHTIEPSNNLKIVGDNIPESGITSAYSSHTFHIDGNDKSAITDAQWYFYLPLTDGNETLVKSAEGNLSFNIDAISDPSNFAININGDIYGKVLFTGNFNNRTIDLQYNVTLELKPSISNVSVIKETNGNTNSYNAICKVDYKGADYLYVTLEEEYGSTLKSKFVREPYLAHFMYNNITSPYYAWIDILVENQYGSEIYTVELPPVNNQNNTSYRKYDSSENVSRNYGFSEIKLYNTDGNYIRTISGLQDTQSLPSGIYVLKYYKEGTIVRTSKLIK